MLLKVAVGAAVAVADWFLYLPFLHECYMCLELMAQIHFLSKMCDRRQLLLLEVQAAHGIQSKPREAEASTTSDLTSAVAPPPATTDGSFYTDTMWQPTQYASHTPHFGGYVSMLTSDSQRALENPTSERVTRGEEVNHYD